MTWTVATAFSHLTLSGSGASRSGTVTPKAAGNLGVFALWAAPGTLTLSSMSVAGQDLFTMAPTTENSTNVGCLTVVGMIVNSAVSSAISITMSGSATTLLLDYVEFVQPEGREGIFYQDGNVYIGFEGSSSTITWPLGAPSLHSGELYVCINKSIGTPSGGSGTTYTYVNDTTNDMQLVYDGNYGTTTSPLTPPTSSQSTSGYYLNLGGIMYTVPPFVPPPLNCNTF